MKTPLRFVRIKFICLIALSLLVIVNSASSQEAKSLTGHRGNINYISFSPDGTKFASAGEDGNIYIWNTETGEKKNTLSIGSNITCAKYSPDGKYLGVTTYEGNNLLLDAESGAMIQKLVYRPNSYSITFTTTCGCLAVNYFTITDEYRKNILGTNTQVKVYHFKVDVYQNGNFTSPTEINIFDEEKTNLTFILGQNLIESYRTNLFTCRLSDNGDYLYTSLPDGNVSEINLKTKKVSSIKTGHKNRVNCIEFSPDKKQFASAGKDEVIKIKGREGNPNTRTLSNHTGDICTIDFSPDGKYLVSGSDDKTVKVWNVESGKEIITLRGNTSDVMAVAFSPDGRYIVSGGKDEKIRVWSTEKILPDLKNFTTKFEAKVGIYVDVETERKVELDAIADLFRPKDEFESTDDFNARIRNAEQTKSDINKKYDDKLAEMKESKDNEVAQIKTTEETIIDLKIEQSRKDTIIRIDYLGKYDADKEIYPVIIKGKSGIISILKADAQSLKNNFKLADVKCKKELSRDLKTYNYYDFIIVHPTTGGEYVFDDGSKVKEEVKNEKEGIVGYTDSEKNNIQTSSRTLNVESKNVQEIYDEKNEFSFEGTYPKINGLSNSTLQDEVNNIFYENYKDYLNKSLGWGGVSASIGFEVLTNNEKVFSVMQGTNYVVWGANGYGFGAYVLTIDLEKNKILKNEDLSIQSLNIKEFNNTVINFFKKEDLYEPIPDFSYVPTAKDYSKLMSYNFAIKDGYIVLVENSMPNARASMGVYIIPIKKFEYQK